MTYIGLILVTVFLFCLFGCILNPRSEKLLQTCFFFSLFSGVSIFTLPEISFYILPFSLSAVLWIFYQCYLAIINQSSIRINLFDPSVFLFLIFLLSVSISTLMPLHIDGNDGYFGANADSGKFFPIKSSTLHLLQLLYVGVGVIFTIFVVGYIRDQEKLELMLRTVILGAALVCCIGLLEVLAFISGFDYQTHWYHTVPTGDGDQKSIRVDGILGISRINSVSYETSNFAQHILVVFSIMYFCKRRKIILFSSIRDTLLLTLMFISLLISVSSTALFGLLIIFFLAWLLETGSLLHRIIYLILTVIITFLVVYMLYESNDLISQILDVFVFNKFSSGSFEARFNAVISSFQLFLRYPVFGVGFGVVPSGDLIVMLLSGVGIFGFIAFLGITFNAIYRGFRDSKEMTIGVKSGLFESQICHNYERISTVAKSLAFSCVILIIIYQAIGFTFRFGDLWVFLSLTIASANIRIKLANPLRVSV